jgi:hypothetical protein
LQWVRTSNRKEGVRSQASEKIKVHVCPVT